MKKWRVTEQAQLIAELARIMEIGTYVELGVRKAHTFNIVAPHVRKAVAVDMVDLGCVVRLPNVTVITGTTEEVGNQWKEPIDLLFIDADHNKYAVRRDFDQWSKFVKPYTGLILMHDTYPYDPSLAVPGYCDNAWEFARTLHTSKEYRNFESVTLPGPYAGLSIVRKVTPGYHMHWQEAEAAKAKEAKE